MREFVVLAEARKRRSHRNCCRQFRSRRVVDRLAIVWTIDRLAAARTHIHPNVAVAFFTRKMSRKNPLHFQLVLTGKRWNLHALPAARIEAPSVIAALHHFSIQPPLTKRSPPLPTHISHPKRFSLHAPP